MALKHIKKVQKVPLAVRSNRRRTKRTKKMTVAAIARRLGLTTPDLVRAFGCSRETAWRWSNQPPSRLLGLNRLLLQALVFELEDMDEESAKRWGDEISSAFGKLGPLIAIVSNTQLNSLRILLSGLEAQGLKKAGAALAAGLGPLLEQRSAWGAKVIERAGEILAASSPKAVRDGRNLREAGVPEPWIAAARIRLDRRRERP